VRRRCVDYDRHGHDFLRSVMNVARPRLIPEIVALQIARIDRLAYEPGCGLRIPG
jgi:hypothetical protein